MYIPTSVILTYVSPLTLFPSILKTDALAITPQPHALFPSFSAAKERQVERHSCSILKINPPQVSGEAQSACKMLLSVFGCACVSP